MAENKDNNSNPVEIWSTVHTQNFITEDNLQEVNIKYCYLTIPAKYVCVYHKLLCYLADFGKEQIDDCTASCKGNGKTIINCWNLFQSAIACHTLGKDKEAEFIIDYIKTQISHIYKLENSNEFTSSMPIEITPDGKLKAYVSCNSETKFYVDTETGKLIEEYNKEDDTHQVYVVKDNNLIYKDINNE